MKSSSEVSILQKTNRSGGAAERTSSTTERSPTARGDRAGRALVECVVAIFLLALSTLCLAVTTRGTLALADDSSLVSHAQALATTRVEDALVNPCNTSASGADNAPRMNLLWQQSGATQNSQLHLQLALSRSPIAFGGGSPIQFAIEAGGVCP